MAAPGKLGEFTVEQRVLVHLWDHPASRSEWDGKREQTQAGIAEAVGISRKHLPRTLRRLQSDGLIAMETRHVKGSKQRCRVYFLTQSGRTAAEVQRESVSSKSVMYEGESTTVGSLSGSDHPLLWVLSKIDEDGSFDETLGVSEGDEEDNGESIYRRILSKALSDGVITSDERSMLDEISVQLGLEPGAVEHLEHEALRSSVEGKSEEAIVYLDLLEVAWQDGHVSEDEEAMLSALASRLSLGDDEVASIRDDWLSGRNE